MGRIDAAPQKTPSRHQYGSGDHDPLEPKCFRYISEQETTRDVAQQEQVDYLRGISSSSTGKGAGVRRRREADPVTYKR